VRLRSDRRPAGAACRARAAGRGLRHRRSRRLAAVAPRAGRPRAPTRAGGALPADGARIRRLQTAGRARRGRRPRASDGEARERDAEDRPAARGARPAAGQGADRGRAAMTEPEVVVVSAEEQQQAEELGEELPAQLPVLPVKETVVFPGSMTPLAIGQERSIRLIGDVVGGDRLLALVTACDEEPETPEWDDLYEVGTAAVVHKMIRVPDGT